MSIDKRVSQNFPMLMSTMKSCAAFQLESFSFSYSSSEHPSHHYFLWNCVIQFLISTTRSFPQNYLCDLVLNVYDQMSSIAREGFCLITMQNTPLFTKYTARHISLKNCKGNNYGTLPFFKCTKKLFPSCSRMMLASIDINDELHL